MYLLKETIGWNTVFPPTLSAGNSVPVVSCRFSFYSFRLGFVSRLGQINRRRQQIRRQGLRLDCWDSSICDHPGRRRECSEQSIHARTRPINGRRSGKLRNWRSDNLEISRIRRSLFRLPWKKSKTALAENFLFSIIPAAMVKTRYHCSSVCVGFQVSEQTSFPLGANPVACRDWG